MPAQRVSEIEQLVPHQWTPAGSAQGVFASRLRLGFIDAAISSVYC